MIFGLSNQVERAQSFPNLLGAGIKRRDLISCGNGLSGL